MSHMPSFSNPNVIPSGSATIVLVQYTATGTEGADFMCPIGTTLVDTTYGVTWSPAGVAAVPFVDLPNKLLTDRTTSAFRVLLNAPLTLGDQLEFTVIHA